MTLKVLSVFTLIELATLFTSKMKWNESGFRPPLCTYRLNWARRTSWGWWDDWDDTVLQTQDSKFEPWRSEAEHATSRSRRLPTILTFTRGWGRNNFVSFKPPRPGTEPRTLAWKAAVLTTTLGPPPYSHQTNNRCITRWGNGCTNRSASADPKYIMNLSITEQMKYFSFAHLVFWILLLHKNRFTNFVRVLEYSVIWFLIIYKIYIYIYLSSRGVWKLETI